MRKPMISLPPIAIEERPEKLSLVVSPALLQSMQAFGDYFTSATGTTPTSFNAVIVGILTGYLDGHGGYQKWLKSKTAASPSSDGA